MVIVYTDRTLAGARPLAAIAGEAVAGGAARVVLREKDLPVDARGALASSLRSALVGVIWAIVLIAFGVFLFRQDDPRPPDRRRSPLTR